MNELIKSTQFKIFITFFFSAVILSLTEKVNEDYGIITNNNLQNIVILFTYLVGTFFYAMFLAKYDTTKVFINHTSRVIFRFILLSIFPIAFIIQGKSWNNLFIIFYNLTVFYIYFELFYNHYKHNDPFSVGNTAMNDKVVKWINKNSKFMMNLFPLWYIAVKSILFIISFILVAKYWW